MRPVSLGANLAVFRPTGGYWFIHGMPAPTGHFWHGGRRALPLPDAIRRFFFPPL